MPRKPSKAVLELQGEVNSLRKVISDQANRIDLSEKARVWLRMAQMGSSTDAYRSTTFSGNGVFSPGEPVLPADPEVEPRLYEYRAGENLVLIPRAGYGLLSYAVLRNLAGMSKEIRLNIEKTKQIIRGFDWDIIFEGPEVTISGATYQATPELERIKHFWEKPDGVHDFDAWIAIVLEEILVTDALTLYPNETEDFVLEVVDGSTIRPLIDFHGRTPRHPSPAYIQVLHGMPTSYYSDAGILYLPRNPKIYTPYGESPIEWILQMIVQSIKHDLGRTTYFTEGNVPGAFAGLPAEWTVQQIQEFSEWYDTMLQGDTAKAHRMMFLPHSGSSLPIHEFNQNSFADPAIDEWLMTIACWAYGNSPSEFGLTRGSGLGGDGYMDAGENSQFRGVTGIAKFLTRVFNRINKEYLDAPWAKFKWKELDPVEDKSTEADVHLKYLGKIYNAAYVQDQLGIPEKYRIDESTIPPPGAVEPGQPFLPPTQLKTPPPTQGADQLPTFLSPANLERMTKGDLPGHPFHGNQYTAGSAVGLDAPEVYTQNRKTLKNRAKRSGVDPDKSFKVELLDPDLVDRSEWNSSEQNEEKLQSMIASGRSFTPIVAYKSGDRYKVIQGGHRTTIAQRKGVPVRAIVMNEATYKKLGSSWDDTDIEGLTLNWFLDSPDEMYHLGKTSEERLSQITHDFKLYKKFAKDAKRKNWELKEFTSEVIPGDILAETHTALKTASTGQIDSIFDQALEKALAKRNPHESVIKKLEQEATDAFSQYFIEAQSRLATAVGNSE